MKVFEFLATGFEETEALAPADMLKRVGVEVVMVSITGKREVTSSHGVTVLADALFEEVDFEGGNMLILPGGMPGTKNLDAFKPLDPLFKQYLADGKYLAAICAAPMVYGKRGFLENREACCFPGFEPELNGATVKMDNVVISGQFITARGAGVSVEFGLKLVEVLLGKEVAEKLANQVIFTYGYK
ncbi:MAG: DJ-1/PfpI family protein [Paludibacteraceae bacterium]|nr:DJ-1/PfpI family protein [Paludibacteraceae bacterium]